MTQSTQLSSATLSSATLLPIITIDGSSGAGKGTLTSRLANQLGYAMLDSGALYRIVGLMAQRQGLLNTTALDETALEALTQSLNIVFLPAKQGSEHVTVLVNGEDISQAIRTEQVGEYASKVAVLPKVRQALLGLQHMMAQPSPTNFALESALKPALKIDTQSANPFPQTKGLVADGRDMGTVVFPQAPVKVYLVASPQARAERRVKQLQNAQQTADYAEILAQIIARDERDSGRSVAPAKPAEDAVVIDSSSLTADQVFDQVWQLCQQRGLV
ncbi:MULTISPECIES: (d)CMP kinase [unclassified Moraxella]|uniref:(d)CMP kinase n=1 Tax=unclassified Moraxella TaxID=2685852 RepID=UPI003AF59F8A